MTTRRISIWISGIAVATLIVAAGVASFVTHTPASSFEAAGPVTVTPALIDQGRYVARLADCAACHSVRGRKPFAGGLAMNTPMGAIYTTNITPDRDTGIGNYSLADFDRALRHGVARDGRRLYPAMPYPSYAKLDDDDVRALYAYFMQAVPPVPQPDRQSGIPWPLNLRWPLALWNAVFLETGGYRKVDGGEADTASLNRGAYLVQGAGHCGSCHTPRSATMNEKALDQGSALYLSGAPLDGWYAPSLRGDPNTGLGRWSEADIVQFLRTGRNAHGVVFGSMADVFNNSTQFMSNRDLHAIARYLKSLPGDPARDGEPWQAAAPTSTTADPAVAAHPAGARTYLAKCAACHGVNGAGQAPWIPPLAGVASMLAPLPDSAINVVLNGSARVVADGVPDAYRMPGYRNQLSDRDLAELLGYVRGAWGNHGGDVEPAAVADLRIRTEPSRSEVNVLPLP